MKIKKVIPSPFIVLILFAFVSCVQPQKKMQAQIATMEKSLFADSSMIPDPLKADSIIKAYINYADQYPDDTLSPEFLFRAGDIANGTGKSMDALGYFGRVQRYPNYSKAATALFLQGFISENYLGDIEGAHRFYEKFLKLYPEHKMAKDAKASLENLGKSPEDLIKEFEAKAKAQNDTLLNK